MSQENVELHYRCLDAFNRRDLDAFLTLMDDDVEAVPRAGAMEGESSYRRHEGVRRWWKTGHDVFPDWNIEVLAVRDIGDLTVADLFVRGHGGGERRSVGPGDLADGSVAAREVRPVALLRDASRSPRSRGAVGARRSRRFLSLRDTASQSAERHKGGVEIDVRSEAGG
jgi:hypothetical protein